MQLIEHISHKIMPHDFRMLFRTVRYNFDLNKSVILSIRSDHAWDNESYQNFMTALSDLNSDDWELIIVRSLFDVDDHHPRTYNHSELSAPEQTLLQIINSNSVRLTCMSHDDQTDFTYSIL